ncbi:3-isopropylmalate dehydratase [bacterium]|nr:3-isopropylmalate dehydratase [bacterium]
MQKITPGKAFVLGDDVDTDQIIPAQYLVYSLEKPEERREYGRRCLSSVPMTQSGLPEGDIPFVRENEYVSDYQIIIAGRNFGCGSSREHAPFALREAGVLAVVAESYARIFFRNAVNGGYLVPFECEERLCETVRTGDRVEIDAERNLLVNRTQGTEHPLRPIGDVAAIIAAGDIFAYARQAGLLPE